ncbi:host-nuclease inhibitor Gam family protein [Martelella radicis]|uniref:Phage host-nuclease inhibitor protein Gam n=1 Tax=Martelella radicis TaxID=1397476 RepID=A0A7W6KMQ8_9HYPH|nr:host-nuclease inhibitor Gam family protein [Martelella radicis]MBB4122944.1 phage host-nuclease inhibitor protein Gam [Martelella radicis]
MKSTRKKTKAAAIARVPQDREEAVRAIGRIGALRRDIAAHKAKADRIVQKAGEQFDSDTADLRAELEEHERGVQTWCEANRNALTANGKVKYHEFGTGRINWRLKPPRVTVRGVEAVIETCRKLGFSSFLRETTEINKEAMLADPEKARMISGVSISSLGEDFVIEPAELETGKAGV